MDSENRKPESEQVRVPMTTRWTQTDYRLVTDTAWCKRISTSELVRRLVLDGLAREGQPAAPRP